MAQLARLVNVAVPTLHGWANGAAPNDMRGVLRLSQVLGISFQELLTGEKPTIDFADAFEISADPVLSGHFTIELRRISPRKPQE